MAKLFGRWVIAFGAGLLACSMAVPLQAREAASSAPYCAALQGKDCDVAVDRLPTEAQRVQSLIFQGGPFRYEKDGVVFGNREGLLPRERRGYYREYTVPTPGARNRGARRIVCGGVEVKAPETCYYTGDHYASFRRIVK
jgi:ribonuclease T1